jgi:hypothetical protein
MREEMDAERRALLSSHAQELAAAKSAFQRELETLRIQASRYLLLSLTPLSIVVSNLQFEAATAHAARLQNEHAAFRANTTAAAASSISETALIELKERHALELARLRSDNEATLARMREDHAAEVAQLKALRAQDAAAAQVNSNVARGVGG